MSQTMIPIVAEPCETCQEGQYIPSGLLLQWHITQRCNLRCAHCYQEGYSGEELPFDDLLAVLQQYKDLLQRWRAMPGKPRIRGHVTVTGGEPFVRHDFLPLLDVLAANRQHFRFAILTNGTFVDAATARRLRRFRPAFVQVSIDGVEATHDRIRGDGSFARAVAAMRHLVWQGIRTVVAFCAHRSNFREFPQVCELGRRLGASRVWADRAVPWGTGALLREQLLTPDETREFVMLVGQACRQTQGRWFRRTEVSGHRALQFLAGSSPPYHCTAGDSLLAVQPNGDVYPCRRMPVRIGNLKESSLTELYYGSDLLRALRDPNRVSRGCQRCPFAGLCHGGLKCLSYATRRDPFSADPGCWLAHGALGT